MAEYFFQGVAVGFLAGTITWVFLARSATRRIVNKLLKGEMIDAGKGIIVFIRRAEPPPDS